MSTMITFAANNEFFRKRKRVHRACESCKKRRKRCSHTFDESDHGELSNAADTNVQTSDRPSQPTAEPSQARSDSQSNATTEDEADHPVQAETGAMSVARRASAKPPRFIGYLSPEAILRGPLREQKNQCGFWVRPADENEEAAEPGVSPNGGSSVLTHNSSVTERALQAYLHAVGVHILPPRHHQDVLLDIYFSYVHPFLPVLDERSFRDRYSGQSEPRLLMQAICIAASKHDKARSHLLLSDDANLLTPREFGQRLYTSVSAAIDARLETDKIVLIQVLTLLSLHCEGFDGAEQASMHLAQAIHHAHTFGLQFGKKRKQASDVNLERLFWCLWSLDKLNASINGRPLIMHDRDNWLGNPNVAAEHCRTPFGIWLQLSELLDKVIVLYRPGVDTSVTGWEDGFPGLEEIIGDGAENLDGPIIAALELFYHAVAMASCNSRSIHDPVRSTPSYVRQSLSAVRVISILSNESPDNLPPLPIIPYALSLAMSVAYRQFRQSKLQMHKNRAKENLKTCCVLLNRLRTAWWSAGAMADLGMAALSKADKASRSKLAKRITMPSVIHQSDVNPGLVRDQGSSDANEHSPPFSDQPRQTFQAPGDLGGILDMDQMPAIPGQHPVSSTRAELSPLGSFDLSESPDWLNFDNAFENFDTLLGSSGADLSSELLKPFNYGSFDFLDPTM